MIYIIYVQNDRVIEINVIVRRSYLLQYGISGVKLLYIKKGKKKLCGRKD